MSFEGKFAQVPSPGLLISLLSGRCFVEFRKLFGLLKTVSLRAVLPFPAWLYLWAASQAWAVVRRWSTAESEASECPLEARGGTDDPEGRSLPGDRQVARDCRCPGSASWTLVPWPRQGWDPESLERLTAACGVHGRIQRAHPRSMSRQVWGRDGVMAGGRTCAPATGQAAHGLLLLWGWRFTLVWRWRCFVGRRRCSDRYTCAAGLAGGLCVFLSSFLPTTLSSASNVCF